MQDLGYELPRILLLGNSVNKRRNLLRRGSHFENFAMSFVDPTKNSS
jgi:hypothetical protein